MQTNLTYDHMYRVKTVDQYYNGGAVTHVAAYTYNELGQVIKKGLGYVSATAWLQNVDLRYNIRGQLLSINNSQLTNDGGVTNGDTNDVFGMSILYDQSDSNLGNISYYDGKISAVKWMSKDGSGNKTPERAFRYGYDGINRYNNSYYSERPGTGAFTYNSGFNESINYDAGGNITVLARNSCTIGGTTPVQIDYLTNTYDASNPNQLNKVTDGTDANHTGAGFRNLTGSTGSYTYDGNGNLASDPYKGLSLTYNALNKTDKITVTTVANRWVDYTYSSDGVLLRKRQYDNNILQTTTDYIDGFVYVTAGAGTPALQYFPMPEGRVLNTGTGSAPIFTQEYIITDQQGNARVSFQNNGSNVAVVKQENSYYATGLIMPNSPVATPTTPNKQLYNGGSEWQNDYANLPDYYMTFNRNYDAAIARFIAVDPIAESAESMTTYQYAGDNPVMFNDPMGDMDKNLLQPPGEHNAGMNYVAPGSPAGSGNDEFNNGSGDGTNSPAGDLTGLTQYSDMTGTGPNAIANINYENGTVSGNGITAGQAFGMERSFQEGRPPVVFASANGSIGIKYWEDANYSNSSGVFIRSIAHTINISANQGGLTHDQELAKYGQISWGYNVSAAASYGPAGGIVETGTIITNKGWARNYITYYIAPGLAPPSMSNSFFYIHSTDSKNLPVFSDWDGLAKGVSGSFFWIALGGGMGSNYSVFSLGASLAPASLNFMKETNLTGGLAVGNTTWVGEPYRMPDEGATRRYMNQMQYQGGY